jgi:hypothetical protein
MTLSFGKITVNGVIDTELCRKQIPHRCRKSTASAKAPPVTRTTGFAYGQKINKLLG